MRSLLAAFLVSAASLAPSGPVPVRQAPAGTLDIYFIDVEGGAATLIVTPSRESVLIDAGWSDVDGRDAQRIQRAMQRAGVSAIDHLIATHYHMDHYGGVPDLAARVEVRRVYDHGPMAVMTEDPEFAQRYAAYRAAARQATTRLEPGAVIALRTETGGPALQLRVVASGGQTIEGEGRANAACDAAPAAADSSENGRSVGLRLEWGDFRFLNLADLTWNVSRGLVCPVDRLGPIDLYQVTHHGGNVNNPPLLLQTLNPTVAVMINGPRKGGHPDTVRELTAVPAMEDVYQLHRNVDVEAGANTDPARIANLDEPPDEAHAIVASVDLSTKSFSVTNGRTGETRRYPIAKQAAAPSPRLSGLLVYDEANSRLMLVNANAAPDVPDAGEVWTWEAARWVRLPATAAPPMRTLTAAAYDARRSRVVLFGGVGNAGYSDLRGDTWEWDGTRWSEVTDATVGTRDHHMVAYDAGRGVTVMYGGVSSDRSRPRDTWVHPATTSEWDGRAWTVVDGDGDNPGPRIGAAMSYDAARGEVILFGGMATTPARLGDTWAWNGRVWRKRSGSGPAPRSGHAMTFDGRSGRIVLFGGASGNGHLDDLWEWDGTRWHEIAVDGRPRPRTAAQIAYDSGRQRLVLYGGYTRVDGRGVPSYEMWEWDGARWSIVS